MAYDEETADRIREYLATESGVTEMRMFGGLAFLVNGNMAVAASGKGGLLLRCDPAQTAALAGEPHVAPFEMRGKPMAGWLRVDAPAVDDDTGLRRWITIGAGYARSLPPKAAVRRRRTA
jgi:TfoX/Sxy family transcriptional regulator of competence genes